MKSAYQLSPIPPFRAQDPQISLSALFSTSTGSQSPPSAHPIGTAVERNDATSQLTSFSFNKKRPAPLKRYSPSNLRLIGHEGSSASPLGTEQTSTDQHGVSPRSGSRPLSPLSQGIEEPLRLPVSQSRSQLARPSNYVPVAPRANISISKPRGSILMSNTDANLTPPATPNSREALFIQAKSLALLSKSNNPQLPPTPSTSPYQKAAPLVPTTVSAKALSAHKLHPVFTANYTLGDELGSGGFGFVVQATRNEDAMQCAVKFIYKEKVPAQAWVRDEHWEDESDTNGIMRTKDGAKRVPLEAYVLKTIRHRGVVAFVDLFEDNIYVYLVMEHHGTPWTASEKENKAPSFLKKLPTLLQPSPKKAPVTGGLKLEMASESRKSSLTLPPPMPGMMRRSSCDLFECIEQHSRLPERYAKYVFAQLVDVVGCLHYNGFVHRDIKDENIVIDDKYRMKLIDFGSTYLFDYRQEPQSLNRFFGTLNFAAPELIKKGSYQPMAAEIWSLGILLSILVTGESFFHDTEAIKHYKASPPNNPVSESCMDLIFRCLAYKPEDRWNCFKIRTHPWLADSQWSWSDLPTDSCTESITRVRKL
ncbi:hypothetical protein MJO28_000497 [Puccinia striiformis f. sp. tritici]|uniref:CAMK protein kinase n=2 Tax=Puccinia striiformis f. sp. tritici TaxID=168172 RepID=A0A0L0W5L2_9BASI|nr:hypothetical protein Pst134EB_001942 [Puccinia striiformis f. sp. tritici]KAI7962403.1 hypothetical protein MJO28_000497 [Puccinia striiformis f. sp. tritici]KAI7967457.1 hypothetical protein MJO29_000734 [Puccinia striiformis f. sp. tritici]KAI9601778.1 hypothetical protein KEM48_001064 [Puccinia striiformis f. sp. tritici PST-130]KNF06791.1 CAMK protein kinase [Puccinia striiformis f. sp. tritici PST-78]